MYLLRYSQEGYVDGGKIISKWRWCSIASSFHFIIFTRVLDPKGSQTTFWKKWNGPFLLILYFRENILSLYRFPYNIFFLGTLLKKQQQKSLNKCLSGIHSSSNFTEGQVLKYYPIVSEQFQIKAVLCSQSKYINNLVSYIKSNVCYLNRFSQLYTRKNLIVRDRQGTFFSAVLSVLFHWFSPCYCDTSIDNNFIFVKDHIRKNISNGIYPRDYCFRRGHSLPPTVYTLMEQLLS